MSARSDFDFTNFDELVGGIYEAAIDSQQWSLFMQRFAEALNAKSCMLRVQHLQTREVGSWFSYNMDPHYQALYREHFVKIDPIPGVLENHAVGSALQSEADMPGDFRGSEFFNDYIKPQKMECLAGAVVSKNESQIALFGIQRPDSIGVYSAQEMALLGNLAPHMQRAIQINRHLMNLEEKVHIASKALDRLPIGVVFVDAGTKPVYFNRRFEKLIAKNNGLAFKSGRLVAHSSRDTNALNKLIYDAGNIGSRQGGSMIIDNPEKTQSLNILVTPVTPVSPKARSRLGYEDGQVVAALFISTSGQQYELPSGILKELYGLTNAEAQLAASLANGDSLDSYAEKQGVSKNTLRNQLKACFHKTGVNRQAELVTLVLSGIPALSDDITNFSFEGDDQGK